jgi:uncharacterized damage-inducible protein DinB
VPASKPHRRLPAYQHSRDPNLAGPSGGNPTAERGKSAAYDWPAMVWLIDLSGPMGSPWVAPPVERASPERVLAERAALDAWLDFQRQTLLSKCAGLTAEQLKRRAVPPSALSLLGLVRHLTDVERWWFRIHAGGQDVPFIYVTSENEDADFDDVDGTDAGTVLEAYRAEVVAARLAVSAKQLDDIVRSHGHHPERLRDVRWIYVHMIEEYARHNGHADLLRESIDGSTGV